LNILSIINFLGGLALFVFGMTEMSNNIQLVAGAQMRRILRRLTHTPLRGVLVGLGITGIIQSSSATTVMLVGFVNAGLLTLKQAVGVVMGANIGTTVTAQLIAFNIGDFALVFVIIGMVMLLLRKSRAMENWSMILIGFGVLFLGLNIMSGSVSSLQDSAHARDLLMRLSTNPFLAILAGTIFTMLIQSSSASVGIVIVLAANGLITFEGALFLVYGDNIGTTITAWLACLNSGSAARQVALVHTLFNVFGTIVIGILTYLGLYTQFVNLITPGNVFQGENVARHIANGHTFFNVLNTIAFLPFSGHLARLATRIIPDDEQDEASMGEPKHLNYTMVSDSYLAIKQSIKEMKEMLRLVQLGQTISFEAFKDRNYKKQVRVSRVEAAIDQLQKEITVYLVAVNEKTNSEDIIIKIPALLHTVNDIEKLGDYTQEINRILNYQIIDQGAPLSDEFTATITAMHNQLQKMIELALVYLDHLDPDIAEEIIRAEAVIMDDYERLRQGILTQIQNGECDAAGGLNTIDYLDVVELAAAKIINITEAGSQKFVYTYEKHHHIPPPKTQSL
jgi:phosphate:Na+ symporter